MMSGGVDVNAKLPGMKSVLFCEAGFGADQHGQDVTKAAMRACRNAIEFNSIPSIRRLVPGGYENMALRVTLAIPPEYRAGLDLDKVRGVFPYGQKVAVVDDGGGVFTSGIALKAMGDVNDDMLVVIAHVSSSPSPSPSPSPSIYISFSLSPSLRYSLHLFIFLFLCLPPFICPSLPLHPSISHTAAANVGPVPVTRKSFSAISRLPSGSVMGQRRSCSKGRSSRDEGKQAAKEVTSSRRSSKSQSSRA
jgi:uncharacterized protein (TIGR02058 family)